MGIINWTQYPTLDRRLVELQHEYDHFSGGELHREIARTLNTEFSDQYGIRFTEDSVRNRLKRVQFDNLGDHPVTVIMPYFQKYEKIIEGQGLPKSAAGMGMNEYLEWMREGRKKTLVLSDLHIPFQQDSMLQHAVESNLTADLIVLNGDLMDAYALSTFVKTKDVPIYTEIDGVVRFFEWLSELYPDKLILITEGNHEARVTRRIAPMIPTGLQFLADTDLLATLAKPFSNIIVIDDWYTQVGDAIYAHSDAASGVAAKPAVDTLQWFINHQHNENLLPFSLVVQAHTHRISVVYQGRYKAIESGSLCEPMAYSRTTKHKLPQQNGYVVVVQHNGKSDFHNSREYVMGDI